MKAWVAVAGCLMAAGAHAGAATEYVCSLAPSQSKAAAAVIESLGGAGAATAAVGQALGLAVVTHSSGAAILTGSGGYIAGTLGAAAAGPFLVTVGVAAVTGAAGLELVCAPRNHPEYVAKVAQVATAYLASFEGSVDRAKSVMTLRVAQADLRLRKVRGDVFDYVLRRRHAHP